MSYRHKAVRDPVGTKECTKGHKVYPGDENYTRSRCFHRVPRKGHRSGGGCCGEEIVKILTQEGWRLYISN